MELTLDGRPVNPPAEFRALMDSVVLDVGEIPPEYLVPAGPGAWRPGDGGANGEETAAEAGKEPFVYDEWDYQRQRYRKDWCRVCERPVNPRDEGFVAETLRRHRPLLRRLHHGFEALREQQRRLRRQAQGDEIDLDALVDAWVELSLGREMDHRLFVQTHKRERDVAVLFMVDVSGSTEGWVNRLEREALVLLCEALERLGDRYAIYGFSGFTHRRCELYPVKRFDEPYDEAVRGRIANLRPRDYTRMGAAIRHLTGVLAGVEARTRLLVTLSDGRPDDQDGYRGPYGIEDTRRALLEARARGVHPFCITIDTEAQDYLPHMYGPSGFTIVDQIERLPFKVSDVYRRLTF
jgi:nitric oxide reductase NorD protein